MDRVVEVGIDRSGFCKLVFFSGFRKLVLSQVTTQFRHKYSLVFSCPTGHATYRTGHNNRDLCLGFKLMVLRGPFGALSPTCRRGC